MMRVLFTLLPTALLWGVAAFAVERLADRELFVPPPDAVAEGFIRAVTHGRHDQARAYLRDPDVEEFRALQRALGRPETVEAKTTSLDAAHALVAVRVSSAHASDTISLSLAFEEGGWRVVLPPGGGAGRRHTSPRDACGPGEG